MKNFSKETVIAFSTLIKKESSQKIWFDKKTEFAVEFKKVVKLKDYKSTPQNVRPRLHLLNVRNNLQTNSLLLDERLWVQVHSQVTAVCHKLEFRKKNSD